MLTSLLASAFVEILKNEWLGIVASAIVLISFLTSNQIKTRLINMAGCIAFVVYGLILPAYSTAFMNGALLVVHVVFLVKYFLNRKKEKSGKAGEAEGAEAAGGAITDKQNSEPGNQVPESAAEEENKTTENTSGGEA